MVAKTRVAGKIQSIRSRRGCVVLFGFANLLCDACAKHFSRRWASRSRLGRESPSPAGRCRTRCDILWRCSSFRSSPIREFGDVTVRFLTAESQLDGRNADLLEQRVEVGGGESLSDAEAERIDAGVEELQRLGVCLWDTYDAHGSMHAPLCARVPPRT